jgi:chemotaxis response regulator CheB
MSQEVVEQKAGHDLVVVGSSAGGISALSVLVSTFGADFSAPVVLAQHLDPQRPQQSQLNP